MKKQEKEEAVVGLPSDAEELDYVLQAQDGVVGESLNEPSFDYCIINKGKKLNG